MPSGRRPVRPARSRRISARLVQPRRVGSPHGGGTQRREHERASSSASGSSARRSPIGPIGSPRARIPRRRRVRTGVERNLVISMWDWALPTSRRSDAAGTDERTPTMNANGPIYGAIQSSDILAVLDPRKNTATEIKVPSSAPLLDADTPASPFWGAEKIWQRSADPRSVAMDATGACGSRHEFAPRNNSPRSARTGRSNKFAKYFPMQGPSARQIELYDPKTKQFTADRHLFRRGPQPVRRQGPARLRPEQRHRLGGHRRVRQDPRRGGLAGMVPGRRRHQRRRQDLHRVDRARSTGRSE